MSAVFSHGRLRLYLLRLLADGPKHGYELIRLLEHRFLGLYAPSAGTIYPRLARMEVDGLVTHRAVGGRKVYQLTDAGRIELTARAEELSRLESDIHASVADLTALADAVEQGVHGSLRDLKRELREATAAARTAQPGRPRRQRWPDATHDATPSAPGPATSAAPSGGATPPPGVGDGAGDPAVPGSAPSVPAGAAELERTAVALAQEVRRLVRTGRAGADDIRVASTVLESVREQVRHLLRG